MNGGRWEFRALGTLVTLAVMMSLTTTATAAPAQYDLQATLPVTVTGTHTVETPDGAFYLQGDEGRVSLLATGVDQTLSRVIHRAYPVVDSQDPELQWEQEVTVETAELDGGMLVLEDRRDTFQLLLDDAPITLDEGANDKDLYLGALQEDKSIRNEVQQPLRFTIGDRESLPFRQELPAGLYQGHTTEGRLHSDGDYSLFLGDAVVSFYPESGESSSILAHFREESHPGSIWDPIHKQWTGIGEHKEYVHEYLLLEGSGVLQIQYSDVPADVWTRQPTTHVDGEALIPAAVGTVDVETKAGQETHRLHGEELTLAGKFTMRPGGLDDEHATARMQGQGDITRVSYAQADHEYPWAAVAAAGFGGLLLAGLAWLWINSKLAIGSLGGAVAGYARQSGDAVLQHEGRQTVYQLVQAHPGASQQELQKMVDFGASTLTYHLRVLERNKFVSRVKDGRYARFFDRQSGEYSRGRKVAASTLRNQQTSAIAECIAANPGVAQCDLAEAFGIAASTVSWHVKRLQEQGLVEGRRERHYTRYYLGEAWSTLPQQEQVKIGVAAVA